MEQVIYRGALPSWLDHAAAFIFVDIVNWGRFGVAMFFLISGFVIPFSFKGERPLADFAISRFFRLYPAYWVSLLLALLIIWLTNRPMPGPGAALVNATMFQTFVRVADVVPAYWTLALELLFYFACAGLFRWKLLSSGAIVAAAVGVCLAASLALAGLSFASGKHLPANLPLNIALMFTGTLVRLAWLNGNDAARRLLPLVLGALIAGTPAVQWAAYFDSAETYVQPLPFTVAYLLAMAAFLMTLRGHWEFGRFWLWMGAISYSVYLVHGPWLQAMVTAYGPLDRRNVLPFMFCVIALALASASLIYYFVEKPFVRLGHRQMVRISPREPKSALPPSSIQPSSIF
ncbi:putative acyltransferase [Novosphingobium sp. Rr 2-17]|nr:putative acyltransferase [Novosphingobium sp. Rr 2-17]